MNLIYIGWSNLWDAKRNGSTTFCFTVAAHETSVTLRRATSGDAKCNGTMTFMFDNLHCAEYQKSPFQLQQILRLPRQMTLMICPRRTSVQMTLLIGLHHTSKRSSTMRRASGVTKYFPCQENNIPKYERYLQTMAETSFTVRGRSDHDPTTIRA